MASSALAALRVGYTYPLVAYLNFCPGWIRYPHCPLGGTKEAASEAEDADALASSDIENNFRSNSEKRGEGEVEGTRFSFFPFSSAAMRLSLLVKDSSVGNFYGTQYI